MKEYHNILSLDHRADFRTWLSQHAATEDECWIEVKRGKPVDNIHFWYLDAVEEALCFGWIDSTVKKMPDGRLAQRISPRRPNSHWTELNILRCQELERRGLMTEAGMLAMPKQPILNG